jgi:hypothetical protein
MSFFQRLRYSMVKPDGPDPDSRAPDERSVKELEADIARADDKERNIGLVAAPLAGLIGILVAGNLINHAVSLHQSTSTYYDLLGVLVAMSVLMMVTALLRKRLFLGIILALYGLSIFNLKFWGFGVPFVLAGAWYLVRAYRLNQKLKLASGDGPGSQRRGYTRPSGVLPRPNKRYTPPTAPAKRPGKTKPEID